MNNILINNRFLIEETAQCIKDFFMNQNNIPILQRDDVVYWQFEIAKIVNKRLNKHIKTPFLHNLNSVIVFSHDMNGFIAIRDKGSVYKKTLTYHFEYPSINNDITLKNFSLSYEDKKMKVEISEDKLLVNQKNNYLDVSLFFHDYKKNTTEVLLDNQSSINNIESFKTLIKHHPEDFFEHLLYQKEFSNEIKDFFLLFHDIDINWQHKDLFHDLKNFDKHFNFTKNKSFLNKFTFK